MVFGKLNIIKWSKKVMNQKFKKQIGQKKKTKKFNQILLYFTLLSSVALVLTTLFIVIFFSSEEKSIAQICNNPQNLVLDKINNSTLIEVTASNQGNQCYQFYGNQDDRLIIDSPKQILLGIPNFPEKPQVIEGKLEQTLSISGKYSILIPSGSEFKNYQISLQLQGDNNLLLPNFIVESSLQEQGYTSPDKDNLKTSNLNNIINDITKLAQSRNLSLDKLSISLIDLNSSDYASYQGEIPRFPASIVKLFWLVIFYEQYQSGHIKAEDIKEKLLNDAKGFEVIELKNKSELEKISPPIVLQKVLERMIKDSDNNAASVIVDLITKTHSSKEKISSDDFQNWVSNRDYLNQFFVTNRGYTNDRNKFNISQKTFPIYYIDIEEPIGADLQIRYPHNEPKSNPIRNKLTTRDLSILLYQIENDQIPNSTEIKALLNRNKELNPQVWQKEPYDSIEYFFGQGIYQYNPQLYSKMGWTFNNRNDGAIIKSADGKTQYILVVFGDDKKYYEDNEFYPKLSQLVYEQMTNQQK
jgi:beta-lactamase class A